MKTALIADDEPLLRRQVRDVLERYGFDQIIEAANGREAVTLAIHQFVELHALREEVSTLRDTLETRKLIDKAKGLLIKKGMTEAEAYRKMQKLSMDKRKTLKEVAEAILLMES